MEVKIHQAFLVVKSRETRLTKDKARQFPIRHWRDYNCDLRPERMLIGQPVPKPICKVRARTLDRDLSGWMILVPDKEAGLIWVRPVLVPLRNQEKIREEGGRWDVLSAIPTVIL